MNAEKGKWQATFCLVHTNRNDWTTSKRSPKSVFGWNLRENDLSINLPSKLFGIFGLVASASGIRYLLNTGLSQDMYHKNEFWTYEIQRHRLILS